MNPQEVKDYINWVIKTVSERLNISDSDTKFPNDLKQDIRQENEDVGKSLDDFIYKYQDWYQFHVDYVNRDGKLNKSELERLMLHIEHREDSRNLLITSLKSSESQRQVNPTLDSENGIKKATFEDAADKQLRELTNLIDENGTFGSGGVEK